MWSTRHCGAPLPPCSVAAIVEASWAALNPDLSVVFARRFRSKGSLPVDSVTDRPKPDADRAASQEDKQTADPVLFYSRHVFCCTNERPSGHPRGCCKNKGSEQLRNYLKVRAKEAGLNDVRINAAGCLDRCELGPTMVIYPEGVWYTYRSQADLEEILETHLLRGGRVERLMLMPDQKPPAKS
jgi:(2Fe-2S) ferredoxin